jgi:uncharacterized membrane protein YoaK (UPF0700 family)
MTAPAERGNRLSVDADAAIVLRRPLAMVLMLTVVAGAMDAQDFRAFGVFTANQAGNLVLVWLRLDEDAGQVWLSIFSLVGCAVGIAGVLALRRWVAWFTSPLGTRGLLVVAAALLGVTAFAGVVFLGKAVPSDPRMLSPGSDAWYAAGVSVSSSALALAVLATVFTMVGHAKAPVISITGPFVDSIRYGAADLLYRDEGWGRLWRAAIGFPVAWTVGAALSALMPVGRGAVAGSGVVLVVAIALFARRVNPDTAPPGRTV